MNHVRLCWGADIEPSRAGPEPRKVLPALPGLQQHQTPTRIQNRSKINPKSIQRDEKEPRECQWDFKEHLAEAELLTLDHYLSHASCRYVLQEQKNPKFSACT